MIHQKQQATLKRAALLVLGATLLSGCLGTRYLKKDERLLYKQSIKAPKGFNTEPLAQLYVQKSNRKIPLLPINSLVWMYYTGAKRYHPEKFQARRDSIDKKFQRKIAAAKSPVKKTNLGYRRQKKIDVLNAKIANGNNFMQWGEKAAVFDTAAVRLTISRFNDYLFNKGYFLGTVASQITENKKQVNVKYFVAPGPPYIIDSLLSDISDSTVRELINKSKNLSLIKKGDQFDQDKITKERERIDVFMKDHGYYDFSRQYVNFDIDTALSPGKHKVALRMDILNPARRDYHKQFVVDSVKFTTDAGVNAGTGIRRRSRVYRDIVFIYFDDRYSSKILSQRVFIRKDSLYSRSATIDTQKQLANLDAFKFVNVNYDTAGGQFIANIFSSPLDRYSWSNEAGMTVTQGFPGPYYNLSFRKRNIFGGLETFDINGRFGFEGVASATDQGNFYRSTQASINGTLTFPQFLFPLGKSIGYKVGKYNPKTKILAGYTYTDRPEYNRTITTLSNTYTWENKKTAQYTFTPTSLNIIRSHISDPNFDTLLINYQKQGNNLINSFKPSFVGSMSFSFTWNPNNYGNLVKSSFFLRAQLETGGTLFNLYKPKFIENEGLALYQYLRASLDIRKNIIIDRNTVLAWRFNSGVAYSYGSNHSLPYEKYFFVGGSNSVRAWRPRRLGVGSYPVALSSNPAADGKFDYRFEKPGEILMEASVEIRQKLFGFVSGAVFVDAGNVWSFQQQAPATTGLVADYTGNTKFKVDQFYKEIGIGTGFGLRFDFSFLVLRLDVGMKAYDPSREEGHRFVLNKVRFWNPYGTSLEPVIYNIGIGYPF